MSLNDNSDSKINHKFKEKQVRQNLPGLTILMHFVIDLNELAVSEPVDIKYNRPQQKIVRIRFYLRNK